MRTTGLESGKCLRRFEHDSGGSLQNLLQISATVESSCTCKNIVLGCVSELPWNGVDRVVSKSPRDLHSLKFMKLLSWQKIASNCWIMSKRGI